MPLTVPTIDGRSYDELRDEALRRIPVHNPAWTNFNASDPGVTLVELFAFMTENMLYRANQIPDRNRRKFLSLLGIPLYPATSARGIVTFANEQGPQATLTLDRGVEVLAGAVPFRTDAGLDLLPVEARVYVKRRREADQSVTDQYRQLYASYADAGKSLADVTLYETAQVTADDGGVDIVRETIDGSLWVVLLTRPRDKGAAGLARARAAIGGKVLSLGIVPFVADRTARLGPGASDSRTANHLRYSVPRLPEGGGLPADPSQRVARYREIEASDPANVLLGPGVVELSLPDEASLGTWRELEPLEAGVGEFPPALDDATSERIVTWIRVQTTSSQPSPILWAGINAVRVTQRAPIEDEALPDGTGDPDQVLRLARRPVVPGSVRLTVTDAEGTKAWSEVEELSLAGPEIPMPDPAAPPGPTAPSRGSAEVFVLDAESGELLFGDGDHGRRPPLDASLRVSYDVSDGTAGNVGPDAIATGPALPPGVKVTNPVRTWGGNDAESTTSGEKRVTSFLRHGERLVTAEDHRAIAFATPEVRVGRVEVLPAYEPGLAASDPGDVPGAVTLLVIPQLDLVRPEAPRPDDFFLDAVCRFLEPRRLVTSELFLRGPDYVPVWVSVGIETTGERSVAETREAVKRGLTAILAPLPTPPTVSVPPFAHRDAGWPLRYAVLGTELATYAGRADGVRLVGGLLLAGDDGRVVDRIAIRGLRLPRLVGISVVVGDPVPIAELQGMSPPDAPAALPVPAPPKAC